MERCPVCDSKMLRAFACEDNCEERFGNVIYKAMFDIWPCAIRLVTGEMITFQSVEPPPRAYAGMIQLNDAEMSGLPFPLRRLEVDVDKIVWAAESDS